MALISDLGIAVTRICAAVCRLLNYEIWLENSQYFRSYGCQGQIGNVVPRLGELWKCADYLLGFPSRPMKCINFVTQEPFIISILHDCYQSHICGS